MNLATFLRESFAFSRDMTVKLAEDMRDAPRTFPTPKGGNHPQWVMGHLTLAEDGLIGQTNCSWRSKPRASGRSAVWRT